MGQAILHIHTTFSDGTATVEEILDDADRHGEIDVVGITDHDDTRAFERALRWKAAHPASRVQPIWGVELTIRAFKHLLLFRLEPPYPSAPPRKFLSLRQAMVAARALGAFVVVPHVDTFWIGLGRHRLAPLAEPLGIDGFELLNPYHGTDRDVAALMALNCRHERRHGRPLLAIGGSDAHHLEDLYRVIVDFPGRDARRPRARVPRPDRSAALGAGQPASAVAQAANPAHSCTAVSSGRASRAPTGQSVTVAGPAPGCRFGTGRGPAS